MFTWTVSNTGGILENEKAPAGYLNKNSNNGKIESARREASAEEKGLSFIFGILANSSIWAQGSKPETELTQRETRQTPPTAITDSIIAL